MYFFTREYIAEHTINGNWSYESNKRVKNHIDIIIAKAENIYQWKKLDEHITLQIIPPRIFRRKKTSILTFISTMKYVEKVFWWTVEKQFVFFHAQIMIAPGIIHISILAIIITHPAIKNTSQYFQQKKYDQLCITQPWFFKKAR